MVRVKSWSKKCVIWGLFPSPSGNLKKENQLSVLSIYIVVLELEMNKNIFANDDSVKRNWEIKPFSCKYCDKSCQKKNDDIAVQYEDVRE